VDLATIVHLAQASAYGVLIAFLAVVTWAWYSGKVHSDREYTKLERENAELKAALAVERQLNAEAIRAGSVTNQLIGALTEVATEKAVERRAINQSQKERSGVFSEESGL
jgi:type II secretory pathway component PulJ